jgi:hypothetical protein
MYDCVLLVVAGVSVVEDLDKAREPLPLAAVYFITPSPAAVSRLLADFATKPLYPNVHVFFSNRASADAVDRIKKCKVGPSSSTHGGGCTGLGCICSCMKRNACCRTLLVAATARHR